MPRLSMASFVPAHLYTFNTEAPIPIDLYVLKNEQEVALFHRAGDILSGDLYNELEESGCEMVYIASPDLTDYDNYLIKNAETLFASETLSPHNKAVLIFILFSTLLDSVFEEPEKKNIGELKSSIDTVLPHIIGDDFLIQSLFRLNANDYTLYSHSLMVGIFGTLFATHCNQVKPEELNNYAHAFFLHDLGKYAIPMSIMMKIQSLTEWELKVIRKHPQAGKVLIDKSGHATEVIDSMIMEHHENFNGSGYPEHLTGDEISLAGRLCRIVDAFEAISANRPHRRGATYRSSLNIMGTEMPEEFDPELFTCFTVFVGRYV